jgi:beta-glucanase (GH16 family)
MNKYVILFLALLVGIPLTAKCQQSPRDTTEGYKLVWADEFNNEGQPDANNWGFEHGFVRNNELQWYQPQNAGCHNGTLVIEARQEKDLANPGYLPQSNNWKTSRPEIKYTSASLNTSGLHSWQYGRFVMRARIDTDAGLWPAFWTLGVSGEWPSNGEIDIMEYYRNKLLANIACGTATRHKAKWYSQTKALETFNPDWSKQFHIWQMDWDKNAISLYVDGQLMNRVELHDLINQDGSKVNPFEQPHYILLNLAIGGDNGGDPALTPFPKHFEIDYVRVYQK